MVPTSSSSDPGFTLIEVAVALAVLSVVLTGLISSTVRAHWATTRARQASVALWLAVERMEQLRGLEWGFGDGDGPVPRSDLSTDLSAAPARGGGLGLSVSALSALTNDTPGLVDYVDWSGHQLNGSGAASVSAAFVRRWRASRLPGATDALVLEVAVSAVGAGSGSGLGDVRLMSVKARKAL